MKLKYILFLMTISCFGLDCTYDYLPEEGIETPIPTFACEELPSWADLWRLNPISIISPVVLSDKSTFIHRIYTNAQNSAELICIYSDSTFYPDYYLSYYPVFSSINNIEGSITNNFYSPPWPQLGIIHINEANTVLAANYTILHADWFCAWVKS